MSQVPPYQTPPGGQAPRTGGGMSTLMIVGLVLLVLALVCCGGCVSCGYLGYQGVSSGLAEPAMARIRASEEVKAKLGENLTASSTSFNIQNNSATADFTVTGSLGSGQTHAEYLLGPNGWEPTAIRVTATDGTVIDVPTTEDPTNLNFDNFDDGSIPVDEGNMPAETVPADDMPADETSNADE